MPRSKAQAKRASKDTKAVSGVTPDQQNTLLCNGDCGSSTSKLNLKLKSGACSSKQNTLPGGDKSPTPKRTKTGEHAEPEDAYFPDFELPLFWQGMGSAHFNSLGWQDSVPGYYDCYQSGYMTHLLNS